MKQLRSRLGDLGTPNVLQYEKNIRQFVNELAECLGKREEITLPNDVPLPCKTKEGVRFIAPDNFYILDENRWEPLQDILLQAGEALLLVTLDAGKKIANLFNCEHKLLNNALDVRLEDTLEEEHDLEKKLQDMMFSNADCRCMLLALIEHSTNQKEKACQFQKWKPFVKVVRDVRVVPSLNGHELQPVSLPFHFEDHCLWVRSTNHWSCMAKALCQRFELRNNLDDAIEHLLNKFEAGLEDARTYLRDKNINEEAIRQWRDTTETASPPVLCPQIKSNGPQVEKAEEDSISKSSESEIIKNESSEQTSAEFLNRTNRGLFQKGSDTEHSGKKRPRREFSLTHSSQIAREEGEKAERWMRETLRSRLKNNGWEISDTPVLDEKNRETDILLQHAEYGIFHVEVKSMAGQEIYWTGKEVAKAQDNAERYFMVILRKQAHIQNQYQEYWLTDPLEQLWNPGKVKILWRWDAQEPDCQILERWEKPQKAPSKEPNNYSFQIRIDLEGLRNIGVNFDKVYQLHMRT